MPGVWRGRREQIKNEERGTKKEEMEKEKMKEMHGPRSDKKS
jgi:hypothetical protein